MTSATYDHLDQCYIGGAFVGPHGQGHRDLIDPATEEVMAAIAMADEIDVDRVVQATKQAFTTFGFASRAELLALLQRILDIYNRRAEDFETRLTVEMGTPITFSRQRWSFLFLVPGPVVGVIAKLVLRRLPESRRIAHGLR